MRCQHAITTNRNWYVIQTKPRKEVIAEANLRRQSFEVYYPQILEPKRYRGKWKEIVQPLFPRYLFACLNLSCDNIAPISSTHGVAGLVRFGEIIRPLPDGFIQELQNSADPFTGLHKPDFTLLQKGDEVVIVSGPFSGRKGVFQATKGSERVAILLELLGRSNLVIVHQHDVTSVSNFRYLQ